MLGSVHQQDLAIVKGLVSVAWADGHVAAEESEIIESLLDAYSATPTERRQIALFAAAPRTLADVPIHELSHDDRRVLLQHAVLLTFIDGAQHEKEKQMLDELCEVLRIPAVEARGIVRAAEERARSMLNLLGSA
jgi:prepilin-type processing-associated H-X9-DG protein